MISCQSRGHEPWHFKDIMRVFAYHPVCNRGQGYKMLFLLDEMDTKQRSIALVIGMQNDSCEDNGSGQEARRLIYLHSPDLSLQAKQTHVTHIALCGMGQSIHLAAS